MERSWNIVFPKDGKEKTRWVRIGTAFEREDGRRIDLHIDAWPVGDFDGKCYLFEREDEKEPEPNEVPQRPAERERADWQTDEYVPKTHFQDAREPYRGVCGHFAKRPYRAKDWAAVTCKACLKHRPPEGEGGTAA